MHIGGHEPMATVDEIVEAVRCELRDTEAGQARVRRMNELVAELVRHRKEFQGAAPE
jgi:hypothetical protein